MAEAALLLVFLAVAVAGPVVLWYLTESETDRTEVMDRQAAEDSARSDDGRDGGWR